MVKRVKREIKQSNILGILSIVFGCLSIIPFLGIVFAITAIVLGIIFVRKNDKKVLGIIGLAIGIIGFAFSAYLIFLLFTVFQTYLGDGWHEVEKSNEIILSKYFPDSYSIGLNRASFETSRYQRSNFSLNGFETPFDYVISDRADYVDVNGNYTMRVWAENIFDEQYDDYYLAMIEEMNSFTTFEGSAGAELSEPLRGEYKGYEYYFSYRNETIFNILCDGCWFSSSKIFVPDWDVVITITYYKPIGRTYSEAVENTELVVRELIDGISK
ncbi:hypothetical protein J4423_04210 [Candidatus Pacearchaeota archaeon]|nr:hypothetical protein [Candidatus Pacearchaeota archaeon]